MEDNGKPAGEIVNFALRRGVSPSGQVAVAITLTVRDRLGRDKVMPAWGIAPGMLNLIVQQLVEIVGSVPPPTPPTTTKH